jgi:hypothetical protein
LPAAHGAQPEQFFASIFWDKKKIGQVHIRLIRGATGEIEELRARASVSMLGINLYEFTQDLTQTWRSGELQKNAGAGRRQRQGLCHLGRAWRQRIPGYG